MSDEEKDLGDDDWTHDIFLSNYKSFMVDLIERFARHNKIQIKPFND